MSRGGAAPSLTDERRGKDALPARRETVKMSYQPFLKVERSSMAETCSRLSSRP